MGGVGGLDLCGFNMRCLARAGRLPCAVEVIAWGHGFGRWYADLTDVANRDRQAGRVADAIRRFRADHPGEPVFLVAKSAGAGIAVKALERLEAEDVERVVLLSPALSPRYDLTAALPRRAPRDRRLLVAARPGDPGRRHLVVRHDRSGPDRSARAWWASSVPGPDEPDEERPHQYAKLRQVRWGPVWRASAIWAVISVPIIRWFLRACVVPLLRADDRGPDTDASSGTDGTGQPGR